MTDEVFNVMKCFPDSYLNPFGDLILSDKDKINASYKDYCKEHGIN